MSEGLDGILSAIDGALADAEFPDAMRWSPEPVTAVAPAPFDGELVWQPPQRYEHVDMDLTRRIDEAFLVDPAHRAEVRAHQRQEAQRIARSIGEWMTDAAEAFVSIGEAIGKAIASLVPSAPPPARSLRETDPMAYALQLRQARGTGPDRQVQHEHRPRRHR
jgi:hypothetical protein